MGDYEDYKYEEGLNDLMAEYADMEKMEGYREEEQKEWLKKYSEEHGGPVPDYFFRCAGEYWLISYERKVVIIQNIKGLAYIQWLLKHPGKAFSVGELLKLVDGNNDLKSQDAVMSKLDNERRDEDGIRVSSKPDQTIQIDDQKEKETLILGIKQVKEELEEAKELSNVEKIAEKEALLKELGSDLLKVKKGNQRTSQENNERNSVGNRISDAIKRIRKHHPILATHLSNYIDKGFSPIYKRSEIPIPWIF